MISANRFALWVRVSKLDWLTADEAAIERAQATRAKVTSRVAQVIGGRQ